MKIITKYRLLMVFITLLLFVAGCLMSYGASLLPPPQRSLGKIMVCGGFSV